MGMSTMENEELARAIEAVLFVAVEPVLPSLLAELLEEPVERVEEVLTGLADGYLAEGRGFVLARIAGGARLQTHPDLAPYVERFANRDVSHRLSTAALETLAIVAYRQPVSRGQISSLRGVNVDGVTRLLEQRVTSRWWAEPTGPGNLLSTAPPTSSWSASASTLSPNSRPSRIFCRGPRWPANSSPTSRPRSACTARSAST